MRRSCLLVSLLLISFILIGCFGKTNKVVSPVNRQQLIVGLSQIGNESSWRICNTMSIKDAADRAGIQLIVDEAQQKQENQLKAIRSFIVYQVDAILLVPIVETGWENVLSEARQARIPVIIVDRKIKDLDKSLYEGFIGEDCVEEGRKAARFLLKKFENVHRKINIIELSGTENSSAAIERSFGFRDEIGSDSRFRIIYSESGDFLKSRGKEIISQIISYNNGQFKIGTKNIDVIFSHNDSMTLGAIEALDSNGIKSGKDVVVVSFDGEQQAINALKDGKINCVVECNPFMGDKLMSLVKTVANRNTIPDVTYVDETVFTEYDDLLAIEARGY